jgi:hypothetical protein
VTNQKTVDVLPRCAECNVPFNRRQIQSNKKLSNILEVYRSIRQANNLSTQLPQVDLFIANNQRRVEAFRAVAARLRHQNERLQVESPERQSTKDATPICKVDMSEGERAPSRRGRPPKTNR